MTIDAADPIRILELRSVRGTGGGPEKTILIGSARSDPRRFQITVCYLRDGSDEAFQIGTNARQLGLDYVELCERHSLDVRIWPQLVDLIRDRRIDIVHAHDYKTDFLALLLARYTRIVPIATVHGWIWNTRRERIYNRLDLEVLRRFPAVITVSGAIRRQVIAGGSAPDRVHHIVNGVDHRIYRQTAGTRDRIRGEFRIPADAPLIGAVGRLSREKRFDLLLTAAARLSPDVHVLIVGDGPERVALQTSTSSLGMSERVRFAGARRDVPDLLQALDLYVQSSDTEGIPNAVLEAMSTSVAVVATDVGGTSELIANGIHGLLVLPDRRDLLENAIQQALTDGVLRARMAAAARQRVEQELSFEARMAKVESLYCGLVGEKRAGAA
jgi:glycosyltransferase involved in cell wall biosynthesis